MTACTGRVWRYASRRRCAPPQREVSSVVALGETHSSPFNESNPHPEEGPFTEWARLGGDVALPSQYRDDRRGLLDAEEAAAILGGRDLCALDLALSGLAAELGDQLVDLDRARRADGMALG